MNHENDPGQTNPRSLRPGSPGTMGTRSPGRGVAVAVAPGAVQPRDLTLTVTPVTSTTTTGSFEIDLTNNSGSDVTVSDFSLNVYLPPSAGVIFTDAEISPLTHPYIFGTGPGYVGSGPPIYTISGSSIMVTGGDSVFALPPWVTVSNGTTVGLAVISYDASGATPGVSVPISFGTGTNADYYYYDNNNNLQGPVPIPLDYLPTPGTIEIPANHVIPEPSTLVYLASSAGHGPARGRLVPPAFPGCTCNRSGLLDGRRAFGRWGGRGRLTTETIAIPVRFGGAARQRTVVVQRRGSEGRPGPAPLTSPSCRRSRSGRCRASTGGGCRCRGGSPRWRRGPPGA